MRLIVFLSANPNVGSVEPDVESRALLEKCIDFCKIEVFGVLKHVTKTAVQCELCCRHERSRQWNTQIAQKTHHRCMCFLGDLRVPLPRAFVTAAEFALNRCLRNMFEDPENLDFAKNQCTSRGERENSNIGLDRAERKSRSENDTNAISERLLENPSDLR